MTRLTFFSAALLATAALAQAQQYTISTVAGIPTVQGYAGDGNAATNAQLTRPNCVSVDAKKNVYFCDIYNHVVRSISITNANTVAIAGNATAGFSGDNDLATSAQLSDPHAAVADSNGNIYIADTSNSRIRKVDSKGNITTFAGNGTRGYSGDGSDATKANLWFPAGLALDGSGNLFVADYGNSTLRKITPAGAISTVAGTGTWGYSGDGAAAAKAQFANPVSVAVDTSGNIFIADTGSNTIRKIGTDGNIRTLVSNVTAQSIAVDSAGAVYFTDAAANLVKKVLATGTVITIAGNGQAGFNSDNIPALSAQLNFPTGVAVDGSGNVYVADTYNQAIRLLTPNAFSVGAVTNTASSVQSAIAPGEIVTLLGAGIGPSALTVFTPQNGAAGTQLAGVTVSFNGVNAPLIYVSSGLISAIAPYELTGRSSADIAVTYNGNTTLNTTVPVVAAAPGIFTSDSTGAGQAAAVNQNGTLNNASNPAKPGSIVSLYLTGEGQTSPAGQNGRINSTAPYPAPVLSVTATVGGQPAVVAYAGAAPGLVAGVMQVNVQIPAGTPTGNVAVVVTVGTAASQTGATVAVSQ